MKFMLSVYQIDQKEQWDSIVCSFREYDVYWLSGYVSAFQLHGDGIPLLFFYDGCETKGINVVMKRSISEDRHFVGKMKKNDYFDFSSPYGYGGWLIEGENIDGLICEYEEWCVNNRIVSEFVRFHPILKNHIKINKAYEIIPLGKTVTMDLSSPEIIWSNITSKNRNVIRKARKNGIKIYNGRYPEIYEIFMELYNDTMNRDHAEDYYYFDKNFYKEILDNLPQNAQVFYAVLEENVIAASIMLSSNGKMNYHLSGSRKEYSSLAASNLLLYEAALWGCANGCKTLYLGGGVGSGEDSLFKFKRSFYRKDDLNRFYIGRKIFNHKEYDKLVELRENISDEKFFPKYRG